MVCPYPRPAEDQEVKRPFRVWDWRRNQHVVGRCYKHVRRALDGALLIVRWAAIGDTFEIYDVRTGQLLGRYLRTPTGIKFVKGEPAWVRRSGQRKNGASTAVA